MTDYVANAEYWIRFEGCDGGEVSGPVWVHDIGRYYAPTDVFITAEWGEVPADAIVRSERIERPEWTFKYTDFVVFNFEGQNNDD